jgi:uncharacterized surface protein with fasciclin (FAS1) repeats
MFRCVRSALAAVVALPLVATGGSAKDVVDTVRCSGGFTRLAAALEAAGLDERLKGPGPFTIFAPTDEAFDSLPPGTMTELMRPEGRDRLAALLDRLIVPERIVIAKLPGGRGFVAIPGGGAVEIDARHGEIAFGEAEVLAADIAADNGVVQIIDSIPH